MTKCQSKVVTFERLGRRLVGGGFDEGVVVRLSTPETVEGDTVLIEIDVAANESVWPQGVDAEGASQEVNCACFGGSAEVDDFAVQGLAEVEPPGFGERSAWRSILNAAGGALVGRQDETLRTLSESFQRGVMKATPHLGLPATVVVFDGRLKTSFAGWGEDGSDAELQAESRHLIEAVFPVMGALEDGVVVELGVVGQAIGLPMFDQRSDRVFSGPQGGGEAVTQATVKADDREHFDIAAALDDESLDEVKAVHFGLPVGQLGQMPSLGRRGPADAALTIEDAPAMENPSDGANGRDRIAVQAAWELAQLAMDGRGSVLAERRFVVQSFADAEDKVFDPLWRTAGSATPAAWPIGPIDAIQAFPLCSGNPFLHSSQTHTELLSDGPWRLPNTDSRDELTPPLDDVFCSW